jgi:hypothetical protein
MGLGRREGTDFGAGLAQAGLDGGREARGQAQAGQQALLGLVELALEETERASALAPDGFGRD